MRTMQIYLSVRGHGVRGHGMSAVVVVFHADVAVVGGGGGGGCGGGVSTVYFLKTKFKYWPLSFPFNFPKKIV